MHDNIIDLTEFDCRNCDAQELVNSLFAGLETLTAKNPQAGKAAAETVMYLIDTGNAALLFEKVLAEQR